MLDLDVDEFKLTSGDNNLQLSAEFISCAGLKLEGYVRLTKLNQSR